MHCKVQYTSNLAFSTSCISEDWVPGARLDWVKALRQEFPQFIEGEPEYWTRVSDFGIAADGLWCITKLGSWLIMFMIASALLT